MAELEAEEEEEDEAFKGQGTVVRHGGKHWLRLENYDLPGHDIQALHGLNMKKCMDKCAATKGCKSLQFYYVNRVCWLKKTAHGEGPYLRKLKGGNHMEPNTKKVLVGEYGGVWYANLNFYDMGGSDIASLKVSNTECLQACNANDKCLGAVFDYRRRHNGVTCWLKNKSPFYEGHLASTRLSYDKDIEYYSKNK